jgi:hypothetical protein
LHDTEGHQLRHGLVEANGVRLHYVTAGAGEPVVLLHGFPQTWREWRQVIPRLAQHYTVTARLPWGRAVGAHGSGLRQANHGN